MTETYITPPSSFMFDYFNSLGEQRICIEIAGNLICYECGMRQSIQFKRLKPPKRILITEYHAKDCKYYKS